MTEQTEARAAFNEAYASLNAAQKQAVDTIDGPVMVIAGPGTGKTQILTLRIANILLSTDTAPESILALTFTEAGARNMRTRLRHFVGAEAYRISIHTFHGFAGELIKRYPDAFPRIIGGTVMNDLNQVNLFTTILARDDIKQLRPIGNPTYYLKPLIHTITELKREAVTPDDLAKIITKQEQQLADTEKFHSKGAHAGKVRGEYSTLEKVITKNQELLTVYRQYEALKAAEQQYDFEDMIGETIAALSTHEDMLRDLQEQYQYVLADEHQDVNGAQNQILELLVSYHDRPNIFVVGDEKQAIFRFQGASLENFLYFEDRFPGTVTITLTDNYRSGQTILDAAHLLIAVADGPLKDLRVPLTAAAIEGAEVVQKTFAHEAVELDDLIRSVAAELEAGVPPQEIAIIVRTNQEVERITHALRGAGMSVHPSADSDILRHPAVIEIEHLLQLVVQPTSEAAWFTVLHSSYLGLSRSEVFTILSNRSYDTPLTTLVTHSPGVQPFLNTLETVRTKVLTDSPHRVLAYLLEHSGFLDRLIEADPLEGPRVVRRLYDEIEALVIQGTVTTLQDVAELLRTYRTHQIALTAPYITGIDAAVQVMTAHKSKGLEFSAVFIPHCTDAAWGKKQRRQNFVVPYTKHHHSEYDPLDDERRLMYVALTRAKTKLVLSYAETDQAGKEHTESRLIGEIDEALVVKPDMTESARAFDPLTAIQSTTSIIEARWIRDLLAERGFSATSLNNVLQSPWDWLYRNALRIPEIQSLPLIRGNVMHEVLEAAVRATTFPDMTAARELLETALGRQALSASEYTQLHERALASLAIYLPHLESQLTATTKTEQKLRVTFETGLNELPELPLTGMLDRMDIDEAGRLVRVVDYKTGTPKTRNAIEGKTKSDDGGYKRQLIFYALLLELQNDDRYLTREAVLSFVEPDSKGEIREEFFTITDAEITALRDTIITTAQNLIDGSWLKRLPAPGETEYEKYITLLLKQQQ